MFVVIGNQIAVAFFQLNISYVCTHQGDYASTRVYASQAVETLRTYGNRRGEGYSLLSLGNGLLGLNLLPEAEAAFQRAVALKDEPGLAALAVEAVAGLIRVALTGQNREQALSYAEEILSYLGHGGSLDMMTEPLLVYLSCYQALHANNDARATSVLATAWQILQERAANITDAAVHDMFLKNVPHHRALGAAWRTVAVGADTSTTS
jgi:tetratricopeptide (TPR) repeat protein